MSVLTIMGFGRMWKTLRLFTRKVLDRSKQGTWKTAAPTETWTMETHKRLQRGTTVGVPASIMVSSKMIQVMPCQHSLASAGQNFLSLMPRGLFLHI